MYPTSDSGATAPENFSSFLLWEAASRDTVDVKCAYIDMVGDLTAGVLLSQIVYWYLPDKKGRTKIRVSRDGQQWVAKLHSDWWDECRVTVRQAERAIKHMVELGIVETRVYKFDGNPTVHIRIVKDKFLERLRAVLEGEIKPEPKGKPRGRHVQPKSKGDKGEEESQKQEERDPFSDDDGDEAGNVPTH